jgi:carboxyl-terminal processing protease
MTPTPPAVTDRTTPPATKLFDNVLSVLRERYYDKAFREHDLDRIAADVRPEPASAGTLDAQRQCAEKLLSRIPASHLGLLSESSYQYLVHELTGQPQPTFGFHAVRIGTEYFTFFVLEGGPAAEDGILSWERIVSIDGVPTAQSRRLDWQQKDAYLSVDRDPPVHSVLCKDGDEASFVLERSPGHSRAQKLRARSFSSFEAAKSSAHVVEASGHTFGYVHFWFIHTTGVPELLQDLFEGKFANVEGLLLDLRGRGGNGTVVPDILRLLENWHRPIVALTDRQSRSAKDVLAYEFKQRHLARVVGERTAGAVIPASFASVGDHTMLMFPSFTLGDYTQKLELKGGVEPDVLLDRAGPFSEGKDPILERGKEELIQLLSQRGPVETKTRASASIPPSTSSPAPATPLPDMPSLIEKMVAALGGESRLRRHAHRTLTGTTELVGLPMKGEFVQKASAPNKSLVVMHLGDLVVRQGFDGNVAWSDSPMTGKQILSGSAAEALQQQAQFYGPIDLTKTCREIVPVRFISFDGKRCIELKLTSRSGLISFMYVEEATSLIAGNSTKSETPVGVVDVTTYFRKYRSFEGYTAPAETYVESSLQRQVINLTAITFDDIPQQEFAPPR